jgi:hypothetical protein
VDYGGTTVTTTGLQDYGDTLLNPKSKLKIAAADLPAQAERSRRDKGRCGSIWGLSKVSLIIPEDVAHIELAPGSVSADNQHPAHLR